MVKGITVDFSSLSKKNVVTKDTLVVTDGTTKTTDCPKEYRISDDRKLNLFLYNKANEITKITRKSRLELGKLFQEVYEKLAGNNHYDGLYTKWIKQYGFNKMTALRYRNRYNLYFKVNTDDAKVTISKLSQPDVDLLIRHERKNEILACLDSGESLGEIIGVYQPQIEAVQDGIEEFIDIENDIKKLKTFGKKLNIKSLDNEKKERLHKLVRKIEELLGE